jgi:alpha-L-rhamnosidase
MVKKATLVWIALFVTIHLSFPVDDKKTEVVDLLCEYLENPLGIDVVSPRLSWRIQTDKHGFKQKAYRILVSGSPRNLKNNIGDVWDSKKVVSEQSTGVTYTGSELKSRQKLFWKVAVWNDTDKEPVWSEVSTWEMALLNQSDWQAQWIGSAEPRLPVVGQKNPALYFRKKIRIEGNPRNARAYISGLGYYELYINGEKVGDHLLSPNQTNYDKRQVNSFYNDRIANMSMRVLYVTYDITGHLQKGENIVSVILGNGWYFQNEREEYLPVCYDTPRFIAQLEIENHQNEKQVFVSNRSWKIGNGPITDNNLYFGETYDARLEVPDWDMRSFDDSMLDNAAVVQAPEGKLYAQMSPPDRVVATIHPVAISTPRAGVYRYDFGTMFSGWVKLKVKGERGKRITLIFREDNDITYEQSDTYILKGEGVEEWEPRFTWHSFRYLDVIGAESIIPLDHIVGKVVHTDVGEVGSFKSSNELFNKIVTDYKRTQLDNMHGGVPTDCPHRERRGYTGDGQIAAQAAILNLDMKSFYTKWLNDIADSQNQKTGLVPNTAPFHHGMLGSVPWGSAYILIPWYMYLYYGDTAILKKHYDGMTKFMHYLHSIRDEDGLVVEIELGEWVPPAPTKIPPSFVSSAFYYHNLTLMTKIANMVDKNSDSELFMARAEKLKHAFNERYLNVHENSYSIGYQGANVFPLAFGLVPEELVEKVFNSLVHNIEVNTKGHFDTGMMGTPYLLEVLTKHGRTDLAYTVMNQRDFPSYGYNIERGATTLWETWSGKDSHSHPMFGSVCAWFYRGLAGINPDPENPGFKHTIIKPNAVDELDFVEATHHSMYGEIASNWRYDDGKFTLNIRIPPNSTASVFVPGRDGADVFVDTSQVHFVGVEGSFLHYEVPSGEYHFISKDIGDLVLTPMLPIPIINHPDTVQFYTDSALIHMRHHAKSGEIRFTLDGSEPDGSSKLYTHPFVLRDNTTIKAKVFREGLPPGFTKSSRIVVADAQANGLQYNYYSGFWGEKLPDFSELKPDFSGKVYNIDLEELEYKEEQFAMVLWGEIDIESQDLYTFTLSSNDGSKLYINGALLIDADGPHGFSGVSKQIALTKGRHKIKIEYRQVGGGKWLELYYENSKKGKQLFPGSLLFFDNMEPVEPIQLNLNQ